MPAFNVAPPAVTISDTAAHVVLPDTDLMADAKQPNCYAGLQLVTTGTLAGNWAIEVSNNSHLGGAALWTNVASGFSPAIAAVLSGGSSQFVQCSPIIARAIRVSFTATSGSGDASAGLCAQPAIPTFSATGG